MSGKVRSRRLRVLLAGLAMLLPSRARRFVHTRLLGYDIHPTATVGRSFIDVDRLVMGEGARIGHLVAIRGCEEVRLGAEAVIHLLVWVNAVRASTGYFPGVDRRPALIMGDHALITVMHFIDACDLVDLADFACLAGYGSIVQTHAVDTDALKQATAPIRIGHHSLVATRALLLPGAEVPDCSIVAAGSVVGRPLKGNRVFAGMPARGVRDVDLDAPLFSRQNSHVW